MHRVSSYYNFTWCNTIYGTTFYDQPERLYHNIDHISLDEHINHDIKIVGSFGTIESHVITVDGSNKLLNIRAKLEVSLTEWSQLC